MGKIIRILSKISDTLYKVQFILLEVTVAVLVIINALQVAGRYFFRYSLPWSEQLSLVLFLVLIMLGGSLAMRTDTEIKITLVHLKNERVNVIMAAIMDFVSLITIVLLLISSMLLTRQALQLKQVISSMNLNYAYVYSIVVLGFLMMGFEKLINLLKHVNEISRNPSSIN
ncbi:MAG: TRAP transporter small permease [Treponema socranskii subsp. buccale]